MDHSEARRLHAAEKYLLGELSAELREEYEEHYFSCEECARELKVTTAFVSNSRAVFKAQARENTHAPQAATPPTWFRWLQPAVAIPIFAALIMLIAYQNLATIPRLKHAAAGTTGLDGDFVSLIGASSRSEGAKSFQIHRHKPVILEVDVPVTGEFVSYVCDVQNEAGRSIYHDEVPASEAKRTVHLIVPKGALTAGTYTFVVFGRHSGATSMAAPTEIDRFRFSVAFVL